MQSYCTFYYYHDQSLKLYLDKSLKHVSLGILMHILKFLRQDKKKRIYCFKSIFDFSQLYANMKLFVIMLLV